MILYLFRDYTKHYMDKFFEEELIKDGYKIVDGNNDEWRDYCGIAQCGTKLVTVYIQDCACCSPHDAKPTKDVLLPWVKYDMCKFCLLRVRSTIEHGNHYTNICVYDSATDYINLQSAIKPDTVWYDD